MQLECQQCSSPFQQSSGRPRTLCYVCKPVPVHGPHTLVCSVCKVEFAHNVGRPPSTCAGCRREWRNEQSNNWHKKRAEDLDYIRRRSAWAKNYRARKKVSDEVCAVDGCERVADSAKGMCIAHYYRSNRGQDLAVPLRKKRNNITPDGYVLKWDGERQRREHRVVMEEVLGRPLEDWEYVHHKNGIRNDNSVENLEVWVTPQPKGQRPEDLAEWVVSVYPELVVEASRRLGAGS